MKKLYAALAAGLVALALFAGCATAPAPLPIPSPQQLAAQLCPVVNADLKALAASPLLIPAQQQVLNGAPGDPTKPGVIAINAAVCAAGATLSVANLQAFSSSAFPALITLVSGLPNLPNQPTILLALQLAQPIVTQVVSAAVTATATSGASAASAPVAASTPLAGAPLQ